MDIDLIKKEIVESLQPLSPEKVILFGSYAYGNPTENSDVDLYIVSRERFIPQNYSDTMRHYKKYTRALKHLKKTVPFDIIVHTREMNQIFEESGSSFSLEIKDRGMRLI